VHAGRGEQHGRNCLRRLKRQPFASSDVRSVLRGSSPVRVVQTPPRRAQPSRDDCQTAGGLLGKDCNCRIIPAASSRTEVCRISPLTTVRCRGAQRRAGVALSGLLTGDATGCLKGWPVRQRDTGRECQAGLPRRPEGDRVFQKPPRHRLAVPSKLDQFGADVAIEIFQGGNKGVFLPERAIDSRWNPPASNR